MSLKTAVVLIVLVLAALFVYRHMFDGGGAS